MQSWTNHPKISCFPYLILGILVSREDYIQFSRSSLATSIFEDEAYALEEKKIIASRACPHSSFCGILTAFLN